jgi:anti-anti-sigma factor
MAVKEQISTDGKVLTISLSGRFDVSVYKDFSEVYKDKLGSVAHYVIDMAEVEYLDSSALGMLLMMRERVGGTGALIEIINCSPGIKKIFQTVNFDKLLPIG